jgi:hypothetical protein
VTFGKIVALRTDDEPRLSSRVYLFNDVTDRQADALHTRKSATGRWLPATSEFVPLWCFPSYCWPVGWASPPRSAI